MTTGDNPSPDPKDWRLLSKHVRQSLVKDLFITSPQAESFFANFDAIVSSDEGLPHLELVGLSGTGKTALVQRWLNLAAQRASALYIPIGPTSLRGILLRGLSQLGYPHSTSTERQSLDQLARLLDQALRAAEKRVLVFDDVQFLVDWQAPKALSPAADILPLSARMGVQLVLVGFPEETDFLLKAFPQQGRRVRTRHVLTPFRWDAHSPC